LENGKLLVADSYLGIFFVDVQSGKKELLVNSFQGRRFNLTNDALYSDGSIFFTESTKYHRRNFGLDILEKAPHGVLYEYNIQKKVIFPVADGFYFANGIEFFDDENVLVVETTMHRISKVVIKGDSKGKRKIFTENLPCYPDNIHYDEKEKIFWVGCSAVRKAPFSFGDFLNNQVSIRKLLAYLPKELLQSFAPKYDLILGFNKDGVIVRSLQDPTGPLSPISHVAPYKSNLYLGSFSNPFVSIIKK